MIENAKVEFWKEWSCNGVVLKASVPIGNWQGQNDRMTYQKLLN
jgi:hypothetical protein